MRLLLLIVVGIIAISADGSEDALQDFVARNTLFTGDIYTEMKSTSGNFIVCPLSVSVVLALVHAGAKGQTAQELSTGVHLPNDSAKIKQIFKELTPHLQGNDHYTLNSANKIYVKDGYGISNSFNSTAVDVFHAEVQNIDFEKNQQAATEMNKWVEEKTDNKIKNLISPQDLDSDTFAILINAIYFHGKWATSFNADYTKKQTFYNTKSDEVEIDMMDVKSNFKYYESSELDAKFLEMPYQGGEITMTIVLPNDREGVPALEARIADVLAVPTYRLEKVQVVLPKFKTESTIKFNDILKARGVNKAFTDDAELTGIGSNNDVIKISKVVQKAFIEVEEKGTTAAAATAVITSFVRSGHVHRFPPKEFIANHPFVYYLKSSSAGILFIGRFSQG